MIEEHKRWMAASEVIPMFPSLVWKIQLEAGLRDSACCPRSQSS
jgi:hypothetical protein